MRGKLRRVGVSLSAFLVLSAASVASAADCYVHGVVTLGGQVPGGGFNLVLETHPNAQCSQEPRTGMFVCRVKAGAAIPKFVHDTGSGGTFHKCPAACNKADAGLVCSPNL